LVEEIGPLEGSAMFDALANQSEMLVATLHFSCMSERQVTNLEVIITPRRTENEKYQN